jgi:glyoxylase-like metal-dependent hydrolase (beta-lactamase superfamily II)
MNLPKVATQLSDTLWFVQALNSGRYPYANSMLVDDRTKCMIDLGVGGSVLRELMNEVKIDEVVFSHCHEDHTAGSSILPGGRVLCA